MPKLLIRNTGLALLFLLLLGGGGLSVLKLWEENRRQKQEQADLTEQLRQATEAQKEATITRRISTQLEEIAYQQKEISDIQRQEAVNQTLIADQMREHAELERERALSAQQAALEAYDQMEEQKKLAETRREEAVRAQMKADTLARLALGRSLGSQASTQYTTGNKDLAALLGYSAWKFTSENNGDVYQPAIFDALSQTSDLSKRWGLHKGAIRDIRIFQDSKGPYLLSASEYGELFLWKVSGNDLIRERILVNNPEYDLRKVSVSPEKGLCVALSHTNLLVVIDKNGKQSEIPLPIVHPVGMELINNRLFVASRDGEVLAADLDRWDFAPVYKHPTLITVFKTSGNGFVFGDDQGGAYALDTNGKTTLLWDKINQPISCVRVSPQAGILAIGYKNGIVIAEDTTTRVHKELIGHISPVTEIRFMNRKLYTSSYDGTVRLWNMDNENKIVSSIVYQPSEWIYSFAIDRNGETIFAGAQSGNLSLVSISPGYMAEEIKKHLVRDFTREEWEYYIGEVSEYETYK